jgi:PIN domain
VKTPKPNTDVPTLLERSVAERRPFQSKGRGFRDALIWETVLELAVDDEVALVTDNWKDFAKGDNNALHSDLKEDLTNRGLPEDRVQLVRSLEAFISVQVPTTEALDRAQKLLAENREWESALYDAVAQAFWSIDIDDWDEVVILDQPTEANLDDAGIGDIVIQEIEIENAYPAGDEKEAVLDLVVRADASFTLVTTPWDAEWLIEEKADVDIDFYSETVAQVAVSGRPIEVHFFATFDPTTEAVHDIEQIEGTARSLPEG